MTQTCLRIASYNIRKARGLDNKRLPARTLEVINALGADIVVLQEADKRLGGRLPAIPREMITGETDFDLLEVSENGISLGWHGNAVLLRRGLGVRSFTRLDLPGLEPRGAVALDLDVGGGFCLVATHLGLMRRHRREQVQMLARATQHHAHVVMAGDFNEWSPDKGLEPLAEAFEIHAPGRSFHARRPIAALDRFALSRKLRFDGGGVEEGALARRASDHLPVWADVGIPAHAVTSIC